MKQPSFIFGLLALGVALGCSTGSGTSTTSSSAGTGGAGSGATGSGGSGVGSGGGFVTCDPFTGAPCQIAKGQTCDFDGVGFSCFDPPNTGTLCGACGLERDGGPVDYCGVGLTCLDSSKCAAFCCDDGDCGPGGACNKTYLGDPNVGVCAAGGAGGSAGSGGSGGSGGGSGVTEPACGAPGKPPSNGACYMP
jgi:hypothetical protein